MAISNGISSSSTVAKNTTQTALNGSTDEIKFLSSSEKLDGSDDLGHRQLSSLTAGRVAPLARLDSITIISSSCEDAFVFKPDDADQQLDKPFETTTTITECETVHDWWILVCAFLINAHTGFNFSAYSVLYVPLTQVFESSRAAVGWIQSIEFSLAAVLGLLVSYPLSVYGCKRIAVIGSALIFVSGTLSCFSPNLAWMYVLKAIIPGIGLSMSILANTVIIQQRFNAHRGLASGLSFVGFSFGNTISPIVVEYLLHQYSVRGTLALLGAIQAHRIPLSLQLQTPKHLLLHQTSVEHKSNDTTRPTSASQAAARRSLVCFHIVVSYLRGSLDFKVLTQISFALFSLNGVLSKFIVYGYIPHTANWAMAAGVSRQASVWAVSVISLATIVCRLTVAGISDRKCVNRLVLFAFGLLLTVISMIPPIWFPGYVGTFVSVIIFGFHNGFTNTLVPVVIVDLLGIRNVARGFALYGFLTAFPTLAATPFTGKIYDLYGNYKIAFIVFAIVGLIAFVLQVAIIIIERRKNRRTKTESGDAG